MSDAPVQRILLATIGNRDPGTTDKPTGALRTARRVAPTHVFLFHTDREEQESRPDPRPRQDADDRGNYPARAAETAEAIQREFPHAQIVTRQLRAPDPTVVGDLQTSFDELLREVRSVATPGAELHVTASSGTPQMFLALTLVAETVLPGARHWQALDPDRAHGDLLRPFDPDLLRDPRDAATAIGALRDCDPVSCFAYVSRLIDRVGVSQFVQQHRLVIDAARAVSHALNLVAEFDLARAVAALPLGQLKRQTKERSPSTAALAQWYGQFAAGRGTVETRKQAAWPIELIALAEREWACGRQSLAVVRLALAIECAVATRLRTSPHRLDPDEFKSADRARLVASGAPLHLFERAREKGAGAYLTLEGLPARLDLLRALDPALDGRVPALGDLSEAGRGLAETRNDLLHQGQLSGARLADLADTYAGGLRFAETLVDHFGWTAPAAAPSAPAALRRIANELADWMGIALTPTPES